MNRRIFFTATFILLVGCQTIPSEPVTLPNLEPPKGKATIVIVRPWHLAYGIRDLSVTVNGKHLADLTNASFTIATVEPGRLSIGGYGAALSWPKREISFDIAEQGVRYVVWRADEVHNPALIGSAKMLNNIRWDLSAGRDGALLLRELVYVPPKNAL